jgi:hypothetical protein
VPKMKAELTLVVQILYYFTGLQNRVGSVFEKFEMSLIFLYHLL